MSNLAKYILFISIFFIWPVISDVSDAATVIMKNGDRITGKIKSMDSHSLLLTLPYAGDISIDRSAIDKMQSEEPLRIMLNNHSIKFGKIEKKSKGETVIDNSITGDKHNYAFSDIAYLNPPPHIAGEGTAFSGEINLGGEFKEGNTVSTKIHADFNSQFDRGIKRYLLNGNSHWESKNRSKTENKWFLQGRYNRLFTPKWYTLGNMSLEFDEFKGLQLRSVTGAGVGYRFLDAEHHKLSIEGGPNFVYENYQDTGKNKTIAFREGGNLEYGIFNNRILFYHTHSVLQGLSDTSLLSIRTSTGLKIPVGILGIHTALQLDWDWDQKPSPGSQKSDTTITIKGGYGW